MQNNNNLLLKNVKIYLENDMIPNGSVLIVNGVIKKIQSNLVNTDGLPESTEVIDGNQLNLIPGFIDGHIHGANGADVMDSTSESIDIIAAAIPKEGTTSFLATTITQSTANIERALINLSNYKNKPAHAEMLGIHLEGPFINKDKAGAQPVKYIKKPDIHLFKSWQIMSSNKIKTITLAPEHDIDGSFIQYLYKSGMNVSAGHTSMDFAGTKRAVTYGVRQLTHICNAMTGIHHRDIGAVGAAFRIEELRAEVIADEIHITPEMLQIIYDNIGSKRINLITDSMRAKYLEPGEYELGGQSVIVTEDRAVLKDSGSLAGSIVKMHECAQNMLKLDDVSLTNVIEMASINPAKQIGVFDFKGSIKEGKDADLLLVDDQLNIRYTICRGMVAYRGGI